MDVNQIAENDPENLVSGRQFAENTGLHGVVESDFFAWPIEVGATPLVRTIARRVARFDWSAPSSDIAATLYQTVIPAQERRDLGEYYTPRWLAKAIVEEIVTDPVNLRVLDPACGSGTFIAECVEHFLKAAKQQNVPDTKIFEMLRNAVTGIDVHPVATHLARAAWVIAAKPAIEKSASTAVTVPIYLGDSLQLRYQSRDLFAANNVTIGVGGRRQYRTRVSSETRQRRREFRPVDGGRGRLHRGRSGPETGVGRCGWVKRWRVGCFVGDYRQAC